MGWYLRYLRATIRKENSIAILGICNLGGGSEGRAGICREHLQEYCEVVTCGGGGTYGICAGEIQMHNLYEYVESVTWEVLLTVSEGQHVKGTSIRILGIGNTRVVLTLPILLTKVENPFRLKPIWGKTYTNIFCSCAWTPNRSGT